MTLFLGIGAGVALLIAAAAAWIDIRTHLLPNRLVLAVAAIGLLVFVIAEVADESSERLMSAAPSAVVMAVPLLLIALAVPALIGFGDVKLAAALGWWLGGLAPAASLGATVGLAVLVALLSAMPEAAVRIARKHTAGVGFGPYLVVGAVVAALTNSWT